MSLKWEENLKVYNRKYHNGLYQVLQRKVMDILQEGDEYRVDRYHIIMNCATDAAITACGGTPCIVVLQENIIPVLRFESLNTLRVITPIIEYLDHYYAEANF